MDLDLLRVTPDRGPAGNGLRVTGNQRSSVRESLELSLSLSPLAQMVVRRNGVVSAASPRARQLLGLPSTAHSTIISVTAAELSATIVELVEHTCDTGEPSDFFDLPWVSLGAQGPLCLSGGVVPLTDGNGSVVAAVVTMTPGDEAHAGLAADNIELQRDNTELRSIADELRTRTDELNIVAIFLQSVLTSLRGAVVVADTTDAVRVWNAEAERMWGIPRRVAMQSRLSELDLGCPADLLRPSVEAGLRGETVPDMALTLTLPDQQESTQYSLSVTPLLGPGSSVHGVTLLFVARITG